MTGNGNMFEVSGEDILGWRDFDACKLDKDSYSYENCPQGHSLLVFSSTGKVTYKAVK